VLKEATELLACFPFDYETHLFSTVLYDVYLGDLAGSSTIKAGSFQGYEIERNQVADQFAKIATERNIDVQMFEDISEELIAVLGADK
ncbi:hypothetical protein Gohar_022461, partial [Gossypium harknessii]|nr:hypothetical protein [Gossypium harknessii]